MLKTLCALVVCAGAAFSAENFGHAQPFQNGDTVCWVGDSITHGGTYHEIVELYYATRFPDRKIRYYNEGIGGDRASMIMSDERYRLSADILSHKCNVATIMLGMNDVGRGDYGPDKTGPEIEKRHQASLDLYEANMQKLIKALQQSGARIILIQPSIYDETTKLPEANPANTIGSNEAIGKCAEMIAKWSKEYHTGIVNFYGVMNEINAREQKKDPAFTLVGKDRIHPGAVGHFVMAYTFLKAQGLPADVAVIKAKVKNGRAELDVTEKALPLVVPDAAKPALDLVPFVQDFDREMLTVSGLADGTYEVQIDGKSVGEYPASELKAGVNLATNPNTPQYQQSAAATKISLERQKLGASIRDVVAQKYGMSRGGVDVSDRAAVEKRVHEQTAKKADPRLDAVLHSYDEPGKREEQYDQLSADLLKGAQPAAHHFVIAKK